MKKKFLNFKFARLVVLVSILAITLFGAGVFEREAKTSDNDKIYKLRFHHFLPSTAPVPKHVFLPWAEEVRKLSGGRLIIDIFPSMQLGGSADSLYDQVVDRTVDVIWVLPGYNPNRFPLTEVFELPFLVENAGTTSKALYEFYQKHLGEEYKDAKVLAMHVHGRGLVHSVKPLVKLSDFKGLRIRGATRTVVKMFENIGSFPVGMPVPKVPESFIQGVIEAAALPWGITLPLKTSDLVSNHIDFEGEKALYTATFVLAMNKDSYDELPDDLKKIIDQTTGIALSQKMGEVNDTFDAAGLKYAQSKNNNITKLDLKARDELIELSKPLYKNWIIMANDKGYNGEQMLQDAKDLIDKHAE